MIVHLCRSQCFIEELQAFGGHQNTCLWVSLFVASLETYETFPKKTGRTKDSIGKYVCSNTYRDVKL